MSNIFSRRKRREPVREVVHVYIATVHALALIEFFAQLHKYMHVTTGMYALRIHKLHVYKKYLQFGE